MPRLIKGLLSGLLLVFLLAAGPARAESALQFIPTLQPPAVGGNQLLQNRFMQLDHRYQALGRAAKLRLAPQRNAINLSLQSSTPASALDKLEIEGQMNRLSQQLSSPRLSAP